MAPRKLYRSNRERVIAGVAGGIAEYFDVDPTLVRLAWVLSAFAGGAGILAYIAAWILIPEAPWSYRRQGETGEAGAAGEGKPAEAEFVENGDRRERGFETRSGNGAWIFGLILVGIGFFMLLRNFIPFLWHIPWWPILIIFLGALLLAGALRR